MSRNPYEVLHLQEDATYDEIKERYRHLTKNLHPDKQPLENYQITKKLFEQIDEAYKSISSPLRRYLFRQYGLPALTILEEIPGEFEQFDVEQLNAQQIAKLRQMMIYLLYEREAGLEMDKNKFNTKSLLNISKMMKAKPQNKIISKRNVNFPQIQNSNFDYEMILPEFYGFANSLAVSHSATNLRNDPKYSVGVSISSVRRLYTNYMVAIQSTVSTEQSSFDVTFDKICDNNLHLKFTPISISNFNLTRPKFSIEKSFSQFQFSAITDLASTSFEFSESNQKSISKSLKLYIQSGSMGLMPKVEWQMGPNLRFYVQLSTGLSFNSQESGFNIQQSLTYGYKLILHHDLKLQLTSTIGYPNYFQISLINSKFRASVPFVTAESDYSRFQFLKVSTMILTYLIYQAYHYSQRRNRRIRQKMLKAQGNRLNEQRRELQKQISYLQMTAYSKRDLEVRYDGLVVVKAYLGERSKIEKLKEKISKGSFPGKVENVRQSLLDVEERISNLIVLSGESDEQIYDITLLVQNQVNGGQLVDYNLEELNKYNPSIFEQVKPYFFLIFIERGQFKTLLCKAKGKISLGGFKQSNLSFTSAVRRKWAWIVQYFIQ